MRVRKIIASLLTICICVSNSMIVETMAVEETEKFDYELMQEKITAENNYNLPSVVDGNHILQAWNWSYENITDNLEEVAEQGFNTIQVSPPNEIKMPTKGVTVCSAYNDNGWWMFYQPAGFQLNESTDNALGTKDEFVEMCDMAHRLGIKIIVDAVIGYMGNDDDHIGDDYDNTSTDPLEHLNPRAAEFEPELLAAQAFHNPWIPFDSNIENAEYDIEEAFTQFSLATNPDLATETQLVQDAIYDYMVELIEAGVDGFCIDSPYHIETTNDTYFASDFWEDTLVKVRSNYPEKEGYAYGRIIDEIKDSRPLSEYTSLMDVTDTVLYTSIMNAVVSKGEYGNALPEYSQDSLAQENVVLWNESHISYTDGTTSALTIEQRNKIWALTAARKSSTGMYFARPSDEVGQDSQAVNLICRDILLGDSNYTSWSLPEVGAVNHFANYYNDKSERAYVQNGKAVIERGNTGAVIVNLNGTSSNITISSTLSDGKYVDSITGNIFDVNNGEITGNIGGTGIAVLYQNESSMPEETTKEDETTTANIGKVEETTTVNTVKVEETTTVNTVKPEENTTVNTNKIEVSILKAKYIYNGKYKKPTVTVMGADGKQISKEFYTVIYKNNKNVGKATVTVTFRGKYASVEPIKMTFKIVPKGTKIKAVAKNKKKITVKWSKKKKQITGYQIQYSTSRKFIAKKTKTKLVKARKNSLVIKKMKANKKYYIRIRTYKKVGKNKYYSSWSKAKTVK